MEASAGMDAEAQRTCREPRPGGPRRTSGDGARATPTRSTPTRSTPTRSTPTRSTPTPSTPTPSTPTRGQPTVAAAALGKRSWIGCTASGSVRMPSIARTQASAAGRVVMQGTP